MLVRRYSWPPSLFLLVLIQAQSVTANATSSWTYSGKTAVASFQWARQPAIEDGALPGVFHVAQLHFHWGRDNNRGSEHLLNGESYPLEVHIVCRNINYVSMQEAMNSSDGLAVLGAFYQVNSSTDLALSLLAPYMRQLETAGSEANVALPPRLSDLLPANTDLFYRYSGSLTTPGCQEVVTWTVFPQPLTISADQVAMFRRLMSKKTSPIGNNFRPVQPRFNRIVLVRHLERPSMLDEQAKATGPTVAARALTMKRRSERMLRAGVPFAVGGRCVPSSPVLLALLIAVISAHAI